MNVAAALFFMFNYKDQHLICVLVCTCVCIYIYVCVYM